MQTQIFLSDQRQHYEHAHCRILKTALADNMALGIAAIEETTIAAVASVVFTPPQASNILLLPLVGNCTVNNELLLQVGEALTLSVLAGEAYTVTNEQADGPCLFLVIYLSVPGIATQYIHFPDLNEHLNNWVTLATFGAAIEVGITKMEGRRESVLPLNGYSMLAFVVNGAFEVNGCLLHRGDALWVCHGKMAEWEALSNDAILLWVKKRVP